MNRQPYDFQIRSVEWCGARRVGIVAHEPGLGKSGIAILASELPALVVCPASVLLHWRREIPAWRPEAVPAFSVVSWADPHVRRIDPATIAGLYRTVIVDEAHYAKSVESARSLWACAVVRAVSRQGRAYALSGTMVPNRPIELWPLLYSMGVTRMSYVQFARRYAGAYEDQWGRLDVRGATNLDELQELIGPHVLRYTKAQVMPELPPWTARVLALDLPLERRQKGLFVDDLELLREPVAMEAMSDLLHVHGLRKVPLVLEHVRDVLEGTRKVVVFAHHRDVIGHLADGLRDYRPQVLMGGMTAKRKDRAVAIFAEDPECRAFIGQRKAAGEGVDGLQKSGASHVIVAEASWVPGDLDQMAHRLDRGAIEDRRHVTMDLLTIHGSIDEHMLRRAVEKAEVVGRILPPTPLDPPSALG